MDKVYLLSLFQTQKGFLKKLYVSQENSNRVISVASDPSLNVLIRILHLVANGQIVLRAIDSKLIKSSKRTKKLNMFESKTYLLKMLNQSREQKVSVLKQFSSLYPILLHSFFNEI